MISLMRSALGWARPVATRTSWWVLLAAVLGGLSWGAVQAHAAYRRSEPGDGAVVLTAPARVQVWFAQELFRRQDENWLRVSGPSGQIVQSGEAQIDDDDRTLLWVALPPDLPAGLYTVEWRTLSAADADTDQGRFMFTVDPQALRTSTPMAEAAPTLAAPITVVAATLPAAAATPRPAGAPAGGCALGLAPLVGIAGLAWRRRRKP